MMRLRTLIFRRCSTARNLSVEHRNKSSSSLPKSLIRFVRDMATR